MSATCHVLHGSSQVQINELTLNKAVRIDWTSIFHRACSSSVNISKMLTISSSSFAVSSDPSLSAMSAMSSRLGKSILYSLSLSFQLSTGWSRGSSSKSGVSSSLLCRFFFPFFLSNWRTAAFATRFKVCAKQCTLQACPRNPYSWSKISRVSIKVLLLVALCAIP